MSIRSIPRDEWPPFCRSFAERHRGWLVTLDVSGQAGILRTEAAGARLVDVTAEIGDERRHDVIRIAVEDRDTAKTRAVSFPLDLQIEEAADGVDVALLVEAADESAILRFRSAIAPEMVDGA